MPQEINGQLDGSGLRIAVVAARFNSHIVESLVGGALDGLTRHGVADQDITVLRCPGSWELPMFAQRLAERDDIDGVIALGAVIRGDTTHYDIVCAECAKGIAAASSETGKPVVFGVLTTDTVEQALNRAGVKHGNKGFDNALAVIECCRLLKALP